MIPLCAFLDRSNVLAPKGKLLAGGGLTSPMRDILTNFSNSKIIDVRPRDVPEALFGGPSYAPKIVDARAGHTFLLDSGNNPEQFAVDDDGWYTTKTSAYVCRLNPNADSSGNKIAAANADISRIIMVAAFKVSALPTSNYSPAEFAFIDVPNGSAYRLGLYLAYISAAHTLRRAHNDGVLKTMGAGDIDKWHLAIAIKDGTTLSHRWLGGVTTTLQDTAAGTYPTSAPKTTDQIQLPINTNTRMGLLQIARWTGNNDVGASGVAQGDLDYTLFDSAHVCKEYDVLGRVIEFTNTGNDVAFEVQNNRGVWKNTDGSVGSANRVWFAAGTNRVRCAAPFMSLRPVLKNSGVMNADSCAVLTSVDTADEARVVRAGGAPRANLSGNRRPTNLGRLRL